MIDIHERALNAIGETLITLQDETVKRMSDALEAAERTAAELRAENEIKQAMYDGMKAACDALAAQLAAVTAERDAAINAAQCASNFLSFDHAGTGEQLKAFLFVKDQLLKVLP